MPDSLPNARICLSTIAACVKACSCSERGAALDCIDVLQNIIEEIEIKIDTMKEYVAVRDQIAGCPNGYPRNGDATRPKT